MDPFSDKWRRKLNFEHEELEQWDSTKSAQKCLLPKIKSCRQVKLWGNLERA